MGFAVRCRGVGEIAEARLEIGVANSSGSGSFGMRAMDDAVALDAGKAGFVAGAGSFVEVFVFLVGERLRKILKHGGGENSAGDRGVVPGVDEPDGAASLAEFGLDETQMGAGA